MPQIKLKSIKGKINIDSVFSFGKSFYSGATKAFIVSADKPDDEPEDIMTVEYAVMISKKTAKRAVVRNRVKRLLRESLRLCLNQSGRGFIKKIVLIRYKAEPHPGLIRLNDIMPEVNEIINRAHNYYNKQIQDTQN